MKKIFTLLLALIMALSLAACGDDPDPQGAAPGGDPTVGATGGTDQPTVPQGQEAAQEDTPFGAYLSEEEILALLESGDMSAWLSADPEVPGEAVDTGGDEPYSGFSNSIIFTDGGSAEGVEYPDFKSQLSPEMQEEWAEMEQAMTDPEMLEMMEGLEGME